MSKFQCYPLSNPDVQWPFCPSYPAAITLCVLFGAITIGHIVQASLYKKKFATIIVMAAAWESIGHILRVLSVQWQLNSGYKTGQQLLILLAPLWINAFIYMLLGRMVHFFLADDRVFQVRARKITLIFVPFDFFSFVVQATGGVMLVPSASLSTQKTGLNVYMAGVGIQILFICLFIALAVRFQQKVGVQANSAAELGALLPTSDRKSPVKARTMLYIIYGTLALIIYRNIYRLIEFSSGVYSGITMHEWYSYVFDAMPMLLALVLLSIFHPGRYLQGPNCDFSEENKMIKMARGERETHKKAAKVQAKQFRLNNNTVM